LEKRFRGSLICRVLGYPVSYGIVKLLLERGKTSLTEITKNIRRSKATACAHMTKLRLANVVRYDRKGMQTLYWIKYQYEVETIIRACEALAKRASRRLESDF